MTGEPRAAETRADRSSAKREPAADEAAAEPDLRIVQTQVFRGPNYLSYDPAIRLLVDLGSLEHWPSNTIPGFNEALLELLPGVGEHSCSRGHARRVPRAARGGDVAGHVAEHIAIELQRESGAQVYRGKTRSAGTPGQYNVIYGYWEEQVGLAAGRLAVRLVNHLVKAGDRVRLPRGARAAHPARRAARVRALDPGDPRRGREPRHARSSG